MTFGTWLHKIEMSAPDDVSGLRRLLDSGEVEATEVRAVLVKSEGDGGVADYSESLARRAFEEVLGPGPAVVASGGSEGSVSPHAVVLGRRAMPPGPQVRDRPPRLSVGTSATRPLLPTEVGRLAHVDLIVDATEEAMLDARVRDPGDIGCILVKSPHLLPQAIQLEQWSGGDLATTDAFWSMTLANGAAALGVGVALGEVDRDGLQETDICRRQDLTCSAVLTSSGPDDRRCQVVVIGNSTESDCPLRIGRSSLENLVDTRGVLQGVRNATGSAAEVLGHRGRVVAMLGSAVAPFDGQIHGRRVTFQSDSVLRYRMTRAATGAVMASVIDDPAVFVTGGLAYHQGSGMVAAIAEV